MPKRHIPKIISKKKTPKWLGLFKSQFTKFAKSKGIEDFLDFEHIDYSLTYSENWKNLKSIYHLQTDKEKVEAEIRAEQIIEDAQYQKLFRRSPITNTSKQKKFFKNYNKNFRYNVKIPIEAYIQFGNGKIESFQTFVDKSNGTVWIVP